MFNSSIHKHLFRNVPFKKLVDDGSLFLCNKKNHIVINEQYLRGGSTVCIQYDVFCSLEDGSRPSGTFLAHSVEEKHGRIQQLPSQRHFRAAVTSYCLILNTVFQDWINFCWVYIALVESPFSPYSNTLCLMSCHQRAWCQNRFLYEVIDICRSLSV